MIATTIIILITGALVISIFVTAVIQKREKAVQKKRLAISKIRYKVNKIQDIMDWLNSNVGEPGTSGALAEVIIKHLVQIQEIDPGTSNIQENINYLKDLQASPPPRQNIKLPSNNAELNSIISKLNRVIELVTKLSQTGMITSANASESVSELKKIYFQTLIDGHIKLGRAVYEQNQIGAAIQHFSFAQEKLNQSNLPENIAMDRSKTISEFIAKVTEKTPAEKQKALEAEAIEAEHAAMTQDQQFKDTSGLGNSNSLFDQKKKW